MERQVAAASPITLARLAGVLYLLSIGLGLFEHMIVKARILMPGNAAGTAANLEAMEPLWRLGIAAELFLVAFTIPLTLILYVLLRPVNRDLALLATFFSLVASAVEAAFSLRLVEALTPLSSAGYLEAFEPAQLHAMTAMSIKAHVVGFGIALFFFGPFFLVSGYLIFRSTYFPRAIGLLYQLAGVAYLANGLVLVLAPRFAGPAFIAMAIPVFVGEVSFCLWLLFRGVDAERWKATTGTDASRCRSASPSAA